MDIVDDDLHHLWNLYASGNLLIVDSEAPVGSVFYFNPADEAMLKEVLQSRFSWTIAVCREKDIEMTKKTKKEDHKVTRFFCSFGILNGESSKLLFVRKADSLHAMLPPHIRFSDDLRQCRFDKMIPHLVDEKEGLLFLGDYQCAKNSNLLTLGICHILNCSGGMLNAFEGDENFSYCNVNVQDDEDEDIRVHFEKSLAFIHEARTKKKKVLVHCAGLVCSSCLNF